MKPLHLNTEADCAAFNDTLIRVLKTAETLPTAGHGVGVLVNALSVVLVLTVPAEQLDDSLAATIALLKDTVQDDKKRKALMDAGGTTH
jgi:hypothetical protein